MTRAVFEENGSTSPSCYTLELPFSSMTSVISDITGWGASRGSTFDVSRLPSQTGKVFVVVRALICYIWLSILTTVHPQ